MKSIGLGLTAVFLLSTTACSQREDRLASEDLKTLDVQEDAASPPSISPTAAPGVAFAYRYQFRMPDIRIAAAQEAHAAACEKIGIDKCRITAMIYRLDQRDRVEASLDISIDPLLARGFGKQAIGEVQRLEGRMTSAEITGEDQNPTLDAAATRAGAASRAVAEAEAALNNSTNANERTNLREQLRVARSEAAIAKDQGAASQAKLDRTPMTFTYYGGAAARGFAGENPATEAWYLFVDSLATMIGVALKALALSLPWLVLAGLFILAWRSRVGRSLKRWWVGSGSEAPPE